MQFLVVMCAVIGLALCGAGGVAAEKPVPRFGINHDLVWTEDADIPGLIQAMKDAGVQSVRIPLRWPTVEPEKGKWSFDKVDRVIRDLAAAKIEPLVLLMGVPAWASGIDPKKEEGFWDCYPPREIADYEEYVGRCVARYKDRVRFWEVWNEQNGSDFYKPVPDSGEYVWLLKAAYKTIKKIDPRATVVMGGLQMNGIIPNPWIPIKTPNFLQKMYHAGAKPYFDVVNIHPYVLPTPNEGPGYCAKLVRDTVEVMKRNGDGAKPLWITEIGCAAGQGDAETVQAKHLEGIFAELGKIPEVKSIYWFTLRDYSSSVCGGEDSMGLIATDGRRKAAFEAYRKLALEHTAGR